MDLNNIKYSSRCSSLFSNIDNFADCFGVDLLDFIKSEKIKFFKLEDVYSFLSKVKNLEGVVTYFDYYDYYLVFNNTEKETYSMLKDLLKNLEIEVGIECLDHHGYEDNKKALKRIANKLGYKVSKI